MEYEKQDHRPLINEFLGKIEIFKELPIESLERIDNRIIKKAYLKGERIMSEYEVAKGVYFVHSGIVKLTKQDEHGNELIVCIKKKGEILLKPTSLTRRAIRILRQAQWCRMVRSIF